MLMTLFLIILFNEVVADINVALDKTVSYCGKEIKHVWLTDGIRSITNAEAIIMHCTKMSYIEIDLEKNFYIHYVVVYEGKFERSGVLDYFKVLVDDKYCGNYPKKSIGPMDDVGMRVNCNVKKSSKNVKIESYLRFGFSISEVEAYTIGSDFEGNTVAIYIGCFKSILNSSREMKLNQITHCIELCKNDSDLLAAFKLRICSCGQSIQEIDRVPSITCNLRCGNQNCGGYNAFSVYLAHIELPRYDGCYLGHLPVNSSGEMSISKCMDACSTTEYIALRKGQDCSCIRNVYDIGSAGDFSCDVSCNSNANESCGGRHHWSVYKGHKKRFLFHCQSVTDQYGVCKHGCKQNYTGDYCFENQTSTRPMTISSTITSAKTSVFKTTFINNFTDTDEEQTSATVFTIAIMSSSTGKEREQTNTFETEIADLSISIEADEVCAGLNPCADIPNSECIQYDSSYKCECMEGFIISSEVCKDIDECEFIPCDVKTSKCINMDGAYRCDCLKSFVELTEFICISNKKDFKQESSQSNLYVFYFFFIPIAVLLILALVLVFAKKSTNIGKISSYFSKTSSKPSSAFSL